MASRETKVRSGGLCEVRCFQAYLVSEDKDRHSEAGFCVPGMCKAGASRLLVGAKVTGVTAVLAVKKTILAKADLVVRFAQHAIAVTLALLLWLAAVTTDKHSPSRLT